MNKDRVNAIFAAYRGEATNQTVSKVVAECQTELATNFDIHASNVIAHHASRIGLTTNEMRRLLHSAEREGK